MTAVGALCAPASALAVPKVAAPAVAPTVVPTEEVTAPVADTATVLDWLANWTW